MLKTVPKNNEYTLLWMHFFFSLFYECNTIQVLCFNMVTFKCPTINRILLTIAQMIPLLNDRDWLVLDTG